MKAKVEGHKRKSWKLLGHNDDASEWHATRPSDALKCIQFRMPFLVFHIYFLAGEFRSGHMSEISRKVN